jgi:site-specific DNA-methyltransferase (adenine-specific)
MDSVTLKPKASDGPPFDAAPGSLRNVVKASQSHDVPGSSGSSKAHDGGAALTPYYEDSAVKLYHGDCREIVPRLGCFDLLLTDPPYSHEHTDGGGMAYTRKLYCGGELKSLSQFDFEAFIPRLLAIGRFFIFFHSRDQIADYAAAARSAELKYDLHFWHKTNAPPFTADTWKSDVEYIALMWRGTKRMARAPQHEFSKLWQSGTETAKQHPTQKPVGLMAKYIKLLQAETVLDPFAGSGTTLRAAKDLGKQAVGIEIEERWCEVAAKRMSQEVLNFAENVAGAAGETGLLVPHERNRRRRPEEKLT